MSLPKIDPAQDCTCHGCDRRIAAGRKVYYRGRLPFCSAVHAEQFDAAMDARVDRLVRRDHLRALRYAHKTGLLRAG